MAKTAQAASNTRTNPVSPTLLPLNVTPLFAESRPAVIQPRRRGRSPANVIRLSSMPRLAVGARCAIIEPGGVNDGIVVEVTQISEPYIHVHAVCGRNLSFNGNSYRYFGVLPKNLRRVLSGASHV